MIALFEYYIYLVMFILPLYVVRFSFLSIPTTLLEILVLFFIIAFFLWSMVIKRKFKFNNAFLLPIILFSFTSLAGLAIAPDKFSALGIIKSWIIEPIIFFFILINVIDSKQKIENLILSLGASAAALSIYSIIQYSLGYFTSDKRAITFFETPNYLAMYIVPIIILQIGLAFFGLGKRRVLSIVFFLLSLFGLILSKSYGGFLGFFAGISFLLFLVPYKNKRVITALFALFVIGLFFWQIPTKKFQNLFNLNQHTSLSSRLEIWNASVLMIKDHLVLGIGLGNFKKSYHDYVVKALGKAPYEWSVILPHNLYLAFWLNLGILGLIAFIWLLVIFFKSGFIIAKAYPLSLAIMASMVAILAHGLVDTPYWKNDLSIFFWILLVSIESLRKLYVQNSN